VRASKSSDKAGKETKTEPSIRRPGHTDLERELAAYYEQATRTLIGGRLQGINRSAEVLLAKHPEIEEVQERQQR